MKRWRATRIYIGRVEEVSGCVFAWGFSWRRNKVLYWTKNSLYRFFLRAAGATKPSERQEMNQNPPRTFFCCDTKKRAQTHTPSWCHIGLWVLNYSSLRFTDFPALPQTLFAFILYQTCRRFGKTICWNPEVAGGCKQRANKIKCQKRDK